ncbi:GNAT family N-acetyltransferase [Ilumatobacter sp.]|uniref:GNAT family N-acetyltransferase n=1 Tax=Ilumatobacter sp. TaxID=1967498 RepID=UPI003C67F0E1
MSTPDIAPLDTPLVVAIDHPSLVDLVPPFVETLCDEPRRFGREGNGNPKPFASLVRKVVDPGRRRFGAMSDGELLGMASLAGDGEVAIAVVAAHRGHGIGSCLLEHIALTAERDGYPLLAMQTTRRSRPIASLGRRFGWTAYDLPHGRVELSLQLQCRLTG